MLQQLSQSLLQWIKALETSDTNCVGYSVDNTLVNLGEKFFYDTSSASKPFFHTLHGLSMSHYTQHGS